MLSDCGGIRYVCNREGDLPIIRARPLTQKERADLNDVVQRAERRERNQCALMKEHEHKKQSRAIHVPGRTDNRRGTGTQR
jgi:hypothetical protein